MKCQGLFSQKNNKKKLLSTAVMIGTLRVNLYMRLEKSGVCFTYLHDIHDIIK